MFRYFKHRKDIQLAHLDSLFKGAVSQLPVDVQIDYCKRLIERSKYDIRHTDETERKKFLVRVVRASQNEIRNLCSKIK